MKLLPEVVKALGALIEDRPQNPPEVTDRKTRRRIPEAMRPTYRQVRFLRNRGIPIPPDLTKEAAIKLIAALPEPIRRLSASDINLLKANGIEPFATSMTECEKQLKILKA